jgi:hypothetical protein
MVLHMYKVIAHVGRIVARFVLRYCDAMACNVCTQTECASIILSPFYVSSDYTSTVAKRVPRKAK